MGIKFANLVFNGLKLEDIFNHSGNILHVITVNAEFIVEAQKDERLKKLINEKFSTFDGQLPYLFAKRKHPTVNIDKISGSELIYSVIEYCRVNGGRVFLLGGSADSNAKSVEILRDKYNIAVDGYSPPFMDYPFDVSVNENIVEKLTSFQPDYLFVGFGIKKQEFWIDDHYSHLDSIGIKMAVGCGGIYDMVSGKKPIAPKFIKKMGLEGVFRFVVEPKLFRFKRLVKSFKFIKYI